MFLVSTLSCLCPIYWSHVCSLRILFSANRRPRFAWRHHKKALHFRSTTHGQLCKLDTITIAMGTPRFDCHLSLHRLNMHTSDNFLDVHNDGINPFTLSTRRDMCSLESFPSRGCLTWGATGDSTRAWWRVQTRFLAQKRGQFLHQSLLRRRVNA